MMVIRINNDNIFRIPTSPNCFSVGSCRNCVHYNTIKCDAMRCDAMRCDAMRCDAIQCDTIRDMIRLVSFNAVFYS